MATSSELQEPHNEGAATSAKFVAASSVSIDMDNPEFRQALQLLEYTNRSVFLTGKAGTGKSTFLRHITRTTKKKYVVLAPTGIAAVNVGGQTIHSFFRAPFKPVLPDDPDFSIKQLRKRLKYPRDLVNLIHKLDLIIIDEISMVRADLVDFMDKVLRVYSGNMRLPFGGKQMLFVGDVFQLEPVATGDSRDMIRRFYDDVYFFNARVFKEVSLIPIELRKVYRQTDGEFVRLLDAVRSGAVTDVQLSNLNRQVSATAGDADEQSAKGDELQMTIAARRATVDEINNSHMLKLKTPAVVYEGAIVEDFKLDSLPTDQNLTLKVGAQVVFIKNDQEKRWVNGTLGKVEKCDEDTVSVRTEDGTLHVVEPVTWNNVKYVYNETEKTVDEIILGSFTQLPLKAAWALTIHKSQGLTFSNVIIDLGSGAFAGGQTYVALSRCRTMEGIKLRTPIARRDVFVKTAVREFSQRFNNPQLVQSALAESRADSSFADAAKNFSDGRVVEAARNFMDGIAIRNECINPIVRRLVAQKMLYVSRLQKENANLLSENARLQAKLEALADEYVRLGNEGGTNAWELDGALRNFDRALDLCPDHYGANIGKSRLYVNIGDMDAAYTMAQKAAKIAPKNIEPLLLLADITAQTDVAEQADWLLKAEEVAPDSEVVLNRLISMYTDLQMTDLADIYSQKLKALKKKKRPGGRRKK